MPQPMTKERKQVAMLQAVLGITAFVIAYMYRGVFVPNPEGGELALPAADRVIIGPSAGSDLYERKDFKDLRRFGEIPVKPLRAGGSAEPFITELR
jgi:hypothetical protein